MTEQPFECCDHPGYTCDEFEALLDYWDLLDDEDVDA